MNPEPRKFSVLIVEDEVSLRNALRDKFIREGFSASDARDGEAGLEAALKALPDIILLDIVMPKMDGIAMLRKLRHSNAWGENVPVILLTNLGLDNEKMMKEIAEDKAVFYLVKSDWPLGSIITKVREVLSVHYRSIAEKASLAKR